ncbi:hypothetical protein TSUD_281490 [Trifolium subterraneum]|uniref:RNase H type-1 domain-containing protein n=1 Tax=Trifolium subterraneum TaxID=3900 RepID=A0A2Z6LW91_TRISU|nr:hypothetical protein TSUD_281490 [Trifolium subterraneum]
MAARDGGERGTPLCNEGNSDDEGNGEPVMMKKTATKDLLCPWTLSVDGSSNLRGSGAGVVLEGPEGVLIEQSLRFAFKESNNQEEYEALIAGMKLAKEMEVQELKVQSDSQLVTNQVSGEFQTKDPQLTKYLEKVKGMEKHFAMFELIYVPREQNARADLLAKHTRMVVEVEDWRSPIIRYLQRDVLPLPKDEATRIRKMVAWYTMVGDKLYKRGFSALMLLCRERNPKHPQANGQAESANKVILRAPKRRISSKQESWVEHLPAILWSYHTTPQSSTGEPPFNMVYGADVMIPVEIQPSTWRRDTLTLQEKNAALEESLDLLPELREKACFREFYTKQRAARKYNTGVILRKFKEGDLVLKRPMGRDKGGKMAANWEGPFRI